MISVGDVPRVGRSVALGSLRHVSDLVKTGSVGLASARRPLPSAGCCHRLAAGAHYQR
jgi:hypothetical protein